MFLWLIPYWGLTNIHPWAPALFGTFVGLLILAVGWSFGELILNILFGPTPVLYSRRIRGLTIKLFLPLMTLIGRALGIFKKDIRASFINVNNELVLSEAKTYPPDKILLLMPHCLQMSRCEMRLTYDINNCKRCGKCPIKGLLEITEAYGVHLAIATERDHRPAHRGSKKAQTHRGRGLRAGPGRGHPGHLPPAGVRGAQRAAARAVPGHHGVHG